MAHKHIHTHITSSIVNLLSLVALDLSAWLEKKFDGFVGMLYVSCIFGDDGSAEKIADQHYHNSSITYLMVSKILEVLFNNE
jgi:hypothetical protein